MISWALGNYPAGSNPWNGQPLRVNPNYTYFTPNVAPTAEEMNFLFGSAFDAAATGITVPGASWQQDILPATWSGGANAWVAAYFDPIDIRWLVAISDGNATPGYNFVYSTQGLGDGLGVGVGSGGGGITLTGHICAVSFDGTHYFAAGTRDSDGAGIIYACTNASAFSAINTDTSATYTSAAACQFNGYTIFAFSESGGGSAGGAFRIPTGSTTVTGPSALNTGTASAVDIFLAASPTLLVCFMSTAGGFFNTTPDGVTWTSHALPAAFAYTDTPTGLCYSPADGAFVVVTAGTDGKTHTYVSYDGLTWAEQGTGLASAPICAGLAVTSAGCLMTLPNFASAIFPIYSVNKGLTWHWSQVADAAPGYTAKTNPKVVASPTGFFVTNNAHARWSHNAGLGVTVT